MSADVDRKYVEPVVGYNAANKQKNSPPPAGKKGYIAREWARKKDTLLGKLFSRKRIHYKGLHINKKDTLQRISLYLFCFVLVPHNEQSYM